jgi:anaerobic sulfite reductase subunit B
MDAATMRTAELESRVAPGPMLPLLYRVAGKVTEAGATTTLTLQPVAAALSRSAPGQFNMLWSWGIGEVPISVSAIPDSDVLVHTIRDVGAVSRALCAAEVGGVVGVRGPFGHGWDLGAARGKDVVIVAGGIGLAPLRPVVHSILEQRSTFAAVSLVVGARSAGELLFREELDAWWRERRIQVRTIVDRPTSDWQGSVGIVTHELPRVSFDPERAVAMVCGPEVMMRLVAAHLADRGLRTQGIQVSLERNMQCAVKHCGHCQLAGSFVCADGPVLSWDVVAPMLLVPEL